MKGSGYDGETDVPIHANHFIIYFMRSYSLLFVLSALPWHALASDLTFDCQGKTRFVHRGAASTYPQDEKRHYHVQDSSLDTLSCSSGESGIACSGLTDHQAMRRVQIDTKSRTVNDTLQMPTSELIFEGRCD